MKPPLNEEQKLKLKQILEKMPDVKYKNPEQKLIEKELKENNENK